MQLRCPYIGHTGTTGLAEMDWAFGERSHSTHFTESVGEGLVTSRDSLQTLLKIDLPLREPGKPDIGGRHRLLTGKIDGRLPMFHLETAVNLEILTDALYNL